MFKHFKKRKEKKKLEKEAQQRAQTQGQNDQPVSTSSSQPVVRDQFQLEPNPEKGRGQLILAENQSRPLKQTQQTPAVQALASTSPKPKKSALKKAGTHASRGSSSTSVSLNTPATTSTPTNSEAASLRATSFSPKIGQKSPENLKNSKQKAIQQAKMVQKKSTNPDWIDAYHESKVAISATTSRLLMTFDDAGAGSDYRAGCCNTA